MFYIFWCGTFSNTTSAQILTENNTDIIGKVWTSAIKLGEFCQPGSNGAHYGELCFIRQAQNKRIPCVYAMLSPNETKLAKLDV